MSGWSIKLIWLMAGILICCGCRYRKVNPEAVDHDIMSDADGHLISGRLLSDVFGSPKQFADSDAKVYTSVYVSKGCWIFRRPGTRVWYLVMNPDPETGRFVAKTYVQAFGQPESVIMHDQQQVLLQQAEAMRE